MGKGDKVDQLIDDLVEYNTSFTESHKDDRKSLEFNNAPLDPSPSVALKDCISEHSL